MKIKNILIPFLALAVACGILFSVFMFTSPVRAKNIQSEHEKMMLLLLPGSESFILEPYTGSDSSVQSVHKAENGYVVEVRHAGYNGDVVMMVGVNNEGKVTGLVVRDMNETIGLGRNAMYDHEFLSQFLNVTGAVSIGQAADAFTGATEEADSSDVTAYADAVTGATVTSKTIARCINSAIAVVTGADATSAATSWGG